MDLNKIIAILAIVLIVLVVAGAVILNPTQPAKYGSKVIVESQNSLYNGDAFSIKLTDLNNSAISNQTVTITFTDSNGTQVNKTLTTNDSGQANLTIEGFNTGNYSVVVNYGGNDNYTSCNATSTLEVKEKVVQSSSSTSSSHSSSSSHSNELNYDSKLNLYYNSEGIVVDPDGKHSHGAGYSYDYLANLGPPI